MCRPTSGAQVGVISSTIHQTHTEEDTMMSMPEPFLTAEITYRQQRASELYHQKPSGQRRSGQKAIGARRWRRWIPRLPSLRTGSPARSQGGRGLRQTAR